MSDKYPLVSIIIPVYNGEKFIDAVYNYSINQDYPNFEIIFIDNNSIDNSKLKIKSLMKTDSRVQMLNEKRQGAGAARNRGVLQSKGELITFFDVDDHYPPDKITHLANILISNKNIGMVFGKIVAHYEHGKKYFPDYSSFNEGINHPQNLSSQLLNFSVGAGPPTIMCRKEIFNFVKGFEVDMIIGEDMAFVFKVSIKYPIYFTPRVVAKSYRHKDSTMARFKRKNPKLDIFYDQYKNFYLPFIYKNNLLGTESDLNVIYLYCMKGVIRQVKNHQYSLKKRMKFLFKEINYLNKYGLSYYYLPLIIAASFSTGFIQKAIIKSISFIQLYETKFHKNFNIHNSEK